MNNPPLAQLAEAIALRANKCGFKSLKGDHPIYKLPEWKIYGPYQRKSDLRRFIIVYDGKQRITISFPKFYVECLLRKQLESRQEIHHINNLEFDDRLENFQIVDGTEHRKSHSNPTETEIFICKYCKKNFIVSGKKLYDLRRNRKLQKKGPYCSRRCQGKENN